ncbi:glycoside hydrolase family 18 protein [Athelia psychrophila]|uniref:Glycoside hydrolase family 18 protein n=1 Tax=Athelia psychrophila TaxID=1759441 RepID=A0A166DFB6_9AGAM|nr:glycoside hydrolase family 18 protein [Fibularhizoctonia sp. CBS 109695]
MVLSWLCFAAASTCALVISPSTATAGIGTGNTSAMVATAWYAGWHGDDFPLANVSWAKYTSMIYAFAETTTDVSQISLEDSDQDLLPLFVQAAHDNNVMAILSVGGWSGSQYFSTAVATPENQTLFVQAALALVQNYSLDGLEFDWEYPNKQGVGCNTISADDSANFLSFLQALRQAPGGANLTLSAAVSITPFVGPDGTPMSDVSEFAKVLNYIEVMNYDVWGSWSASVGPNAPLNDTCAPPSDQEGSAVSAVQAWTSANFPANQIILGVASYGHSFSVPQTTAVAADVIAPYPAFSPAQPAGDSWDGVAGIDQCGNPVAAGGIFDFWGLVDGGFLNANGTSAPGIDYLYDNCSQTPYVYNPTSQVMVAYDDATSFTAKGQFIVDAGLAGFAMWEAGGDLGDILLDAIKTPLA